MKKYIVREGDTMWEISKTTGVRLNLLIAANPQVKDPNQLQPGSLIVIPELGKHESTADPTGQTSVQQPGTGGQLAPALPGVQQIKPTPPPSKIEKPQTPESYPAHEYYFGFVWPHVVVEGETWESISSHYGVTLGQLKHMNPELSNTNLHAGQVVYVPSPATPPAGKSAPGVHPQYPQYPGMPGGMPSQMPQYPQYPGMPGGMPSQMPQYPQYPGMPGGMPSQMPQYPQYPGMPGGMPSQMPQYPAGPDGVPLQLPGVQQGEQGPHTHNPYRSGQYLIPGTENQYQQGTAYPVSAWYNDWEDSSTWELENGMDGSLPSHE